MKSKLTLGIILFLVLTLLPLTTFATTPTVRVITYNSMEEMLMDMGTVRYSLKVKPQPLLPVIDYSPCYYAQNWVHPQPIGKYYHGNNWRHHHTYYSDSSEARKYYWETYSGYYCYR